jgi:hypothetical protein
VPSRKDPTQSRADIIENAERIEQYLATTDRETFAANGSVGWVSKALPINPSHKNRAGGRTPPHAPTPNTSFSVRLSAVFPSRATIPQDAGGGLCQGWPKATALAARSVLE